MTALATEAIPEMTASHLELIQLEPTTAQLLADYSARQRELGFGPFGIGRLPNDLAKLPNPIDPNVWHLDYTNGAERPDAFQVAC